MPKIEPRTLQGFFDYSGEEMSLRRSVEDKIRSVFVSYGYEELNTPSIEYADILFGKYGEEEKLIYHFNDHGDRHVALRYDQTVPLARFVAQNYNTLTFPFKRYEIGRVWRADAARKARKREFMQCDVDILGDNSSLADAEILMITMDVFKKLEIDLKLHVSDRKILSQILEKEGVKTEWLTNIVHAIDKYDKIGQDGVLTELEERFEDKKTQDICKKATLKVFELASKSFNEFRKCFELENSFLVEIFDFLQNTNFKEGRDYTFNLTLVRGLDYYTGMVFEARKDDYKASFAGGGRYDNLSAMYTDKNISGVGVGIGFEPIITFLKENSKLQEEANKVLVTVFDLKYATNSIKICEKLRNSGIICELFTDYSQKIGKQFKYADKKDIKKVVIIGEDEAKNNTYTLKDLSSGQQETLNLKDLIKKLSVAK